MYNLLLKDIKQEPIKEIKSSLILHPLLQKDPKEGIWKYVTTLQIPKNDKFITVKEERKKGNHLPTMDDNLEKKKEFTSFFIFYFFFSNNHF
ncbi:unnamed protein product [Brugia pahangi]|uniref:Uncharacterized protein n=1 Tax=Brugia pahangi TaxID=6280 RepID=A0A0N4TE17_BRUPA|nr:unnamed protein product [Brugia pahangi]